MDNEIENLECLRDAIDEGEKDLISSLRDGFDTALTDFRDGMETLGAKLDKVGDLVQEGNAMQAETLKLVKALPALLEETKDVLLRGIFDASELTIPNCFVILPTKLDETPGQAGIFSVEEEELLTGLDLEQDEATVVKTAIEAAGKKLLKGKAATADFSEKVRAAKKRFSWMNQCMKMVENPSEIAGTMASKLQKTQYLYLVDEITKQPIVPKITQAQGSKYPIEIKEPSKHLKTLLPLMSLTVKAASVYNGPIGTAGRGLALLFGLPLPAIPQSVITSGKDMVKKGKGQAQNEAVKCGMLEAKKKGDSTKVKVKGQALRDFEAMLKEKDPDRTYAGLERIMTKDGFVIHALPSSIKQSEDEAKANKLPPLFPGYEDQRKLDKMQRKMDKLESAQVKPGDASRTELQAPPSQPETDEVRPALGGELEKRRMQLEVDPLQPEIDKLEALLLAERTNELIAFYAKHDDSKSTAEVDELLSGPKSLDLKVLAGLLQRKYQDTPPGWPVPAQRDFLDLSNSTSLRKDPKALVGKVIRLGHQDESGTETGHGAEVVVLQVKSTLGSSTKHTVQYHDGKIKDIQLAKVKDGKGVAFFGCRSE